MLNNFRNNNEPRASPSDFPSTEWATLSHHEGFWHDVEEQKRLRIIRILMPLAVGGHTEALALIRILAQVNADIRMLASDAGIYGAV
jgi:hypothetical protein